MRILFFLLFFQSYFLLAQEANPRWFLGGGVAYMKTPGINVNVTYRLIADLHIGPDFSAFLTEKETSSGISIKRDELEFNFNSYYLFRIVNEVSVYPLMGVNWSKTTVDRADDDISKEWTTGMNTGVGIETGVEIGTVELFLFFESKYVSNVDKYVFTLGIVFEP